MKLAQRIAKRFGFVPAKRNGGFHGAQQSRILSDWVVNPIGPNAELRGAIRTLRDRARDLEKNNAMVRRYLHLVSENVIGHKGIRLQAKTASPDTNKRIEEAYCDWSAAENYSIDGRLSRASFEQIVVKTVARDGEAFIRKIWSGPYGFSLQLIDAALIDETMNTGPGDAGNTIKLGIELDKWNRAVAYHVRQRVSYDLSGAVAEPNLRIPAAEMIHLFIPRQPGAVRGETWLSPAMTLLRIEDGYLEAELVAARSCAAKPGFIQLDKDTEIDPSERVVEMDGAPGTIEVLGPGETFHPWDPQHPSQNVGLFITEVDRKIAAALNVAHASLTGNLREVNFATTRIGVAQERDGWRVLQAWFAEHFCESVLKDWKRVAWMTGKLPLRMDPNMYEHRWQPRGWPYTNPQQEQAADGASVALGFNSPQRIVADNGEDIEEIYAEIAEARALAEKYGIELFIPNTVINPDANANGNADANADNGDGSGGAGDAGRGGRSHSGLALIRSAS